MKKPPPKLKSMTAAEAMAMFEADPEFVARRTRQDAEHQRREAELSEAEVPLIEDLRAAGYRVESVWDLVNTTEKYADALPILLQHMPRPYPAPIREGIARALAVREAKYARQTLMSWYRNEQDERVKDGLAVAVSATADDDTIEDIVALVHDQRQGPSRVLLLSALEKSRDPRARGTLVALATDPDLKKEIPVILRRLQRKK